MIKTNDLRLSENFKISEFRCKSGDSFIILEHKLIKKLQELRNFIKRPVIISSGFRSTSHNINVGGSPNSLHTKGKASDIIVNNMSMEELFVISKHIFNGVGIYDNHIHVDIRDNATSWDLRENNKGVALNV